MEPFGRFAVRFRYLIVILWVVGAIASVRLLPSLSSVSNSDNSSFLPASSPSLHALNLTNALVVSSSKTSAQMVAARTDGALTTDDQTAIATLLTALSNDPHVVSVRDQGTSADGQVHRASIGVNIAANSSQAKSVVTAMRASVANQSLPSGLSVDIGGALATNVDNQVATSRAQRLTYLFSFLIILVMLLIVFRSLLAPILTLAPAAIVLVTAGPIIAEASSIGLQVSSSTQLILTVLILGAGTDYGLFLTLRTLEELRRGLTPEAAIIRAVGRVGESITFSAATVVGALLCLLLANFGIYRGLGPGLAIGIALMLVAALTLLPALLAIAGHAAFWPIRIVPGVARPGMWGAISGQIVRRPVLTLAIGVVFFGALASFAFGYAPAGYFNANNAPAGSESASATAIVAAHYPTSLVTPTTVVMRFPYTVWADLPVVQKAQQELSSASVFSSVSGLLNPNGTAVDPTALNQLYALLGPPANLPPNPPAGFTLPLKYYNAYRATAQFVSPDGATVEFFTTLSAGPPTSAAALQATPAIRQAVSAVAQSVGAIDNGVLGQATYSYDISHTSDSDLTHIVPIVLALIALLLIIVMRSLVAPIYLVLSVALSFFASLGVAVLVFMRIGGDAGLNFILPFLMFVFLMALGEDYNILIMSRIREEAHQFPLREAITRALSATGTTVTSAGLILAASFAVAGFTGNSDQIHQLGIAIAVGVLLDTFLVRTLLVPSIVALLGRWNWWPSALSRSPANHPTTSAQTAAVTEE